MKKRAMLILILGVFGATALPSAASARQLCFQNAKGIIMAKGVSCATAEEVAEVAAADWHSLRPYTIHVSGDGTWRCVTNIRPPWRRVYCHRGQAVVGIAVRTGQR